mgnify:CR=1 FL=1
MSLFPIFDKIFDNEGNFIHPEYDPHYYNFKDPEQSALHSLIFDEDHNLHEHLDDELYNYIQEKFFKEHSITPFSHAVHLYYAELSSSATNKQYSTASMFKR